MPDNPSLEAFRKRVIQPKGMSSAAWEVVNADIRERSFFLAGIANAEILNLFKNQQERYLSGNITEKEYRRALREGLDKLGYRAPEGKGGTIKDIGSFQRQNLVMETNQHLAAGYANYAWQMENIDQFAAKKMVRLTIRREPRNWKERWKETAKSYQKYADTFNTSKMAALVDSPIWYGISRFGVPYPVYDYNSGMGDDMLSREEAIELGLNVQNAPQTALRPPVDGFNSQWQATPRIDREDVKRALNRDLKGLAKLEGDKLEAIDPNGTKPVKSQDVARTIGTENNHGIKLSQKDALETYMTTGPSGIAPDSVEAKYFSRLIRRVEGEKRGPSQDALAHGMRFSSQAKRDEFLVKLQTRTGGGWDGSTSFPYPMARRDIRKAVSESNSNGVILIVNRYYNAKDLGPATAELIQSEVPPKPEMFFDPLTLFAISNIMQRPDGPVMVTIEEKEDEE